MEILGLKKQHFSELGDAISRNFMVLRRNQGTLKFLYDSAVNIHISSGLRYRVEGWICFDLESHQRLVRKVLPRHRPPWRINPKHEGKEKTRSDSFLPAGLV